MACKTCENYDRESSECRALPPIAGEDGDANWPRVKPGDWCAEDTTNHL